MPLKPIKTKCRLEQLKHNPLAATKYAWKMFDNRRWPEAELYIKKDKKIWKYYRGFFQLHGRI